MNRNLSAFSFYRVLTHPLIFHDPSITPVITASATSGYQAFQDGTDLSRMNAIRFSLIVSVRVETLVIYTRSADLASACSSDPAVCTARSFAARIL
jgi:hypothetical protein